MRREDAGMSEKDQRKLAELQEFLTMAREKGEVETAADLKRDIAELKGETLEAPKEESEYSEQQLRQIEALQNTIDQTRDEDLKSALEAKKIALESYGESPISSPEYARETDEEQAA